VVGTRRQIRFRADGRRQQNEDEPTDRVEEGKTLYYPDMFEELRCDSKWKSYSTTVEFENRGEPQTFVVNETPFSRIGFNMVRTKISRGY
jgi:hypothetical protein